MRHSSRFSVRGNDAGDIAPGMMTLSTAMRSAAPAQAPIAAGNYTVTQDAPLRGSTATTAAVVQTVPAGTVVTALGDVDNYFADVIAPGPLPIGVRGWISVALLTPTQTQPAAQPGGPNQGANTPPPGTPGATTQPITPVQGSAPPPSSGIPSWAIPAGIAAALLGWFFLVEQKKKGGRR